MPGTVTVDPRANAPAVPVRSRAAPPAGPPTRNGVAAGAAGGAVSLSKMVTVVEVGDPTVAPLVGFDRVRTTVAFPSARASLVIGTASVAVVWPWANVTVIGTGPKSVPFVAVPPVTSTVTANGAVLASDRVRVRVGVPTPSLTVTADDVNRTPPNGVGAAVSPSVMVRTAAPWAFRATPLVGFDRVRLTVSSPSTVVALVTGLTTVAVVWPSAKVTVVGTGPKSVPFVAVPPVAARLAVNAPPDPPVRVGVMAAVVPASPTEYVGALNRPPRAADRRCR